MLIRSKNIQKFVELTYGCHFLLNTVDDNAFQNKYLCPSHNLIF